jgi:hypothetical protein
MVLEKKAKEKLEDLLEMSQSNYDEMSKRWKDLESNLLFSAKKSNDFRLGYAFGKMEHKFISWFYSEYGVSQTDQEYEEFSNMVLERILRTEKIV